ncbi:urea ABC transporter ATP-binding subunit UrtE [Alteribacillus sp. HJP-4]|uniref:urea ABC transporter ATP-binding subunit UrtE n=1 Tax=Alteribacillus sp. HJP-4 TaxID=2775394 RepID=UPI0035CD3064
MLQLHQLDAGYGESLVLKDISLHVKNGKVVCILGRNGVGKSTLIKTIIGVLKTSNGEIVYDEKDVTRSAPFVRAKKGMGYVPQGREIFSNLTVYENLILGFEAGKKRSSDVLARIYKYFPILKEMKNRNGGDLSGGQQQQLAIGRALVAEPALLLLDEPAEGIQPNIVQDIQDVILNIKETTDTSMILVEQNISFAREVGDYFYVMDRGRIVFEGPEIIEKEVNRYLSI